MAAMTHTSATGGEIWQPALTLSRGSSGCGVSCYPALP